MMTRQESRVLEFEKKTNKKPLQKNAFIKTNPTGNYTLNYSNCSRMICNL